MNPHWRNPPRISQRRSTKGKAFIILKEEVVFWEVQSPLHLSPSYPPPPLYCAVHYETDVSEMKLQRIISS